MYDDETIDRCEAAIDNRTDAKNIKVGPVQLGEGRKAYTGMLDLAKRVHVIVDAANPKNNGLNLKMRRTRVAYTQVRYAYIWVFAGICAGQGFVGVARPVSV